MSSSITSPSTSAGFQLDARDRVAALFWGGIFAGLLPFLVKYCRAMWYQSLYQYFPFLLAAVFGLAYTRFDRRIRLPSHWFSKYATLLAMIAMMAAAVLASSWLGAIAFSLATAGFLSSQFSRSGRSLGYLAVPMLMFIRAPLLGTYTVMHRLQGVTTKLASIFLDVFGVIHYNKGHTIELVTKSLFVAEACSGVQSLFTMCFLTLLLWAYRQRPYALVPVYLVFAFFFAVVGNVIRVTSIAVAEAWFTLDLTEGVVHELVGYAALAIAAGMMASLDHVLGLAPGMDRTHQQHGDSQRFSASSIAKTYKEETVTSVKTANSDGVQQNGDFDFQDSFNRLTTPAKTCVIASLACGAAMLSWMLLRGTDTRPIVARDAVLFEPNASFLSGLDAPIQVVNHEHRRDTHADRNARHGMNSDAWQCGINATKGQFVLSQPYMGWHELTICYRGLDWQLVSRTPTVPSSGSDPIVVANFVNESGQYGSLFFTAVDSDGSIPRAPGFSSISRSLAPLEPLIFDDFAELTGSAQTIMLQYWVVADDPLTNDGKQVIIDTMDKIRGYTSEKVAMYTADLLE